MKNKFNLKSDQERLKSYWFQTLVGFAIGLVLIFAGQIFFLWSVTSAWSDRPASGATAEKSTIEDRLTANRLFGELESRPQRLAEVLATSTTLIDPSL